MNGFEVATKVTANGSGAQIVLVSSRDGSDFGPLVHESGACGFIPKGELSGARLSRARSGDARPSASAYGSGPAAPRGRGGRSRARPDPADAPEHERRCERDARPADRLELRHRRADRMAAAAGQPDGHAARRGQPVVVRRELGRRERRPLYTIGQLCGSLILATAIHLLLAYPSGRLQDGFERRVAVAGYAAGDRREQEPALLRPASAVRRHVPDQSCSFIRSSSTAESVLGLTADVAGRHRARRGRRRAPPALARGDPGCAARPAADPAGRRHLARPHVRELRGRSGLPLGGADVRQPGPARLRRACRSSCSPTCCGRGLRAAASPTCCSQIPGLVERVRGRGRATARARRPAAPARGVAARPEDILDCDGRSVHRARGWLGTRRDDGRERAGGPPRRHRPRPVAPRPARTARRRGRGGAARARPRSPPDGASRQHRRARA